MIPAKNLKIDYSLTYAFNNNKCDRCFTLYVEDDHQDFPSLLRLLSQYEGEIVFRHKDIANGNTVLSNKKINSKLLLVDAIKFKKDIVPNCYFVFKNSSDHNQFKLSL